MIVFLKAIFFLTYANSVLALDVKGILLVTTISMGFLCILTKIKGLLAVNLSSLRYVCHIPIHLLSLEEVLIQLFRSRITGLEGLHGVVSFMSLCAKR